MKLHFKVYTLLFLTMPLVANDFSLFGKLFGQSISIVIGYLFCNDLVGITQALKPLSVTNLPEEDLKALHNDIEKCKQQKRILELELHTYIQNIQTLDEQAEDINPETKKGKKALEDLKKNRAELVKKLEQNRNSYQSVIQLLAQRKDLKNELIKQTLQTQSKMLEGAFEGYIKTMHSIKAQEYSQPGKHS